MGIYGGVSDLFPSFPVIVVHEKKADVVRSIFASYLAGASLGNIVDMLHAKDIPSSSGNPKWGRAAVDKLLSNAKYIPIIGMETYMDAQFERERRCNVDYDKAGYPRKRRPDTNLRLSN